MERWKCSGRPYQCILHVVHIFTLVITYIDKTHICMVAVIYVPTTRTCQDLWLPYMNFHEILFLSTEFLKDLTDYWSILYVWRFSFQKRVVRTNFYIYDFISQFPNLVQNRTSLIYYSLGKNRSILSQLESCTHITHYCICGSYFITYYRYYWNCVLIQKFP